jgi:SAM-dependent methyltransferase
LIVSVDNLEHIVNDVFVLENFHASLKPGGTLVVHVPHYYRRWPVFRLTRNFNVPGHVRTGYHLPELTERVRRAGFHVQRSGFSYGWLENLMNNLSYTITGARERNRMLYAVLFPLLNLIAWFGQWGWPRIGAGVWLIAEKTVRSEPVPVDEED